MRKKLLVVDDDPAIRNVLQLSFETLGYEVVLAAGGKRGELLAHQVQPNCIILDVMLPDKDGSLICAELKRDPITAQIPIVLVTAKNLEENIHSAFDCGADAYVTKPYEPRELEALVGQLIVDTDQGRRSVAWTGLPDASKVLEEASASLNAEGEVFLAELSFPDEPKKVFIQKYGQGRFRELIHTVAWKIEEVIRESAASGFVGQKADDSFLVLIHPSEAGRVESQVQKETACCIDANYDRKESASNTGMFWQHAPVDASTGVRKDVPLLRLQWKALEAPVY